MGVWITCRSPAPNVIVLYRWRERGGKRKDRLKTGRWENQRTSGISQKNQGLIITAVRQSSVTRRQRDGESQKLSRYMTIKAQAIPLHANNVTAKQQQQQHQINESLWETGTPVTGQVSCAGDFPLQGVSQGDCMNEPWNRSWDRF